MAAVTVTAVFQADLHHLFAHQYQGNLAEVLAPAHDLQVADSIPVVVAEDLPEDSTLVVGVGLQVAALSAAVADHQ